MKIVINNDWGGFSVSEAVYKELGLKWDGYGYVDNEDLGIKGNGDYLADYHAYRADPRLIKAIEKIGLEKAEGGMARLKIVEIPDDVEWEIHDYDGCESVHEQHRSW